MLTLTVDPRIPLAHVWGGGWEVGNCPRARGWKAGWATRAARVFLIGRPGLPGCASLMRISAAQWDGEEEWDVALYGETPEEVRTWLDLPRSIRQAELAELYFRIPDRTGFGLEVLAKLAQAELIGK